MAWICFQFLWGVLHPFFVSVTEMQYNANTRSVEISVRIFTDDFENTLRMQYPHRKIDLINPPADGSMDTLVKQYLLQKMAFEINRQRRQPVYIGFERSDESVWTYLEIPRIDAVQQIKIVNPILYEYKKEQINMVHVINGTQRKSRKLDNPQATWEFLF